MLDIVLNETWVHGALVALAVITPLAGLLAGGLLLRRFDPASARALRVALMGIGPVTGALWLSYNYIVGLFGLDSVAGLLLNAALFALVGVAGGVGWRMLARGDGAAGPAASGGTLDSE